MSHMSTIESRSPLQWTATQLAQNTRSISIKISQFVEYFLAKVPTNNTSSIRNYVVSPLFALKPTCRISFIALSSLCVRATAEQTFYDVLGGRFLFAMTATPDASHVLGGYINNFTGGIEDIAISKLWPNQSLAWAKTLGGIAEERALALVTSGDDVIGTGFTKSFGAGGQDIFLAKWSTNGTLLWAKTCGSGGDEVGNALVIVDDVVMLAGFTTSVGVSYKDALLSRWSINGTLEWMKTLGWTSYDEAHALAITAAKKVAMVGRIGGGSGDAFVSLWELDGTLAWIKSLGQYDITDAAAVTITVDDAILVNGYTYSHGMGSSDFFLSKWWSNGTLAWVRILGGAQADEGLACVATSDGFIASGLTESTVEYQDVLLSKWWLNGTVAWSRLLGAPSDGEYGSVLGLTPNESIILGIYALGNSQIAKLDASGQMSNCSYLRNVIFNVSQPSLMAITPEFILQDWINASVQTWDNITILSATPSLTRKCVGNTTDVVTTGIATTGISTTGLATTGVGTTGQTPSSTTGITTTGVSTTGQAPPATTGIATTGVATTGTSTTGAVTTGESSAPSGNATTGVATTGTSTTGVATTGESSAPSNNATTGFATTGTSTTGATTSGESSTTPSQGSPSGVSSPSLNSSSESPSSGSRSSDDPSSAAAKYVGLTGSPVADGFIIGGMCLLATSLIGTLCLVARKYRQVNMKRNMSSTELQMHSVTPASATDKQETQPAVHENNLKSPPSEESLPSSPQQAPALSPSVGASVQLVQGPKLVSSGSTPVEREEGGTIIGQTYRLVRKITRDEAATLFAQTGVEIKFQAHEHRTKPLIGAGRFGKLRIAQNIHTKAFVGVKKIKGDKEIADSQLEAMIQKYILGLPNVMPILDSFETKGANGQPVLYQFMPLAGFGNGDALKAILNKFPDVKLKRKILGHVAKSVLIGLSEMHNKHVAHLDLKASNIVISQNGEVFIIDFGCALHEDDIYKLVKGGGDTTYFSPGRLAYYREFFQVTTLKPLPKASTYSGAAADLWALAIMLIELMTDHHPLPEEKIEHKLESWDPLWMVDTLKESLKESKKDYPELCNVIEKFIAVDGQTPVPTSAFLNDPIFSDAAYQFFNDEERSNLFIKLKSGLSFFSSDSEQVKLPLPRSRWEDEHYLQSRYVQSPPLTPAAEQHKRVDRSSHAYENMSSQGVTSHATSSENPQIEPPQFNQYENVGDLK